jgi:hypothetical protein
MVATLFAVNNKSILSLTLAIELVSSPSVINLAPQNT